MWANINHSNFGLISSSENGNRTCMQKQLSKRPQLSVVSSCKRQHGGVHVYPQLSMVSSLSSNGSGMWEALSGVIFIWCMWGPRSMAKVKVCELILAGL